MVLFVTDSQRSLAAPTGLAGPGLRLIRRDRVGTTPGEACALASLRLAIYRLSGHAWNTLALAAQLQSALQNSLVDRNFDVQHQFLL